MICRNHVETTEGIRRCARCAIPYCPDCLVEIGGRPYCAECKQQQLLDFRSGVDASQLPLATIWQRVGAYLIDYVLLTAVNWAIMLPAMFAAGMMSNSNATPSPWFFLVYIPTILIPILYEALMVQKKNGQTLGKMALKIRVVRVDGSPVSPGQAWGRMAIKFLGCGCLTFIPAFFTPERLSLHDMAASTRVVETT
jgi:uncharacterized RDD family membrane protein YckC